MPPSAIAPRATASWSRPRPGPDGIIRRMDVRAREGNTNWAVFALANSGDEQIERLIVVPHYRMVGSGVFWPDLGLSRVASITSSGERPDRQDSATADIFRITLDPGSVMTYVLELRGGQAQPALSVGARSLQGQGQQHHALPRHRHRHCRTAGAVPDHPVRGQGQHHVPGRRRARLGGAGLYRHRFRLLGQGVRAVAGLRADLARIGRGDPRRHAGRVPVRLSQSQPLARALCPYHARLARLPGGAGCARAVRAADRLGHRPGLARCRRGARLRPRGLSVVPRLRPRGAADPDLVPAGGLGDRGGAGGHRRRSPTTSSARRSSAAWC